jgi:hypothetical protein
MTQLAGSGAMRVALQHHLGPALVYDANEPKHQLHIRQNTLDQITSSLLTRQLPLRFTSSFKNRGLLQLNMLRASPNADTRCDVTVSVYTA